MASLHSYDSSERIREEEAEKLLRDDADLEFAASARRRHKWCNISLLSWIGNVVLLGVVAFLLLERSRAHRGENVEVAGDLNGVWPKLPQEIIEFQPDDRFTGNLTSPTFLQDVKEHWLNLVPRGLGFIEVPDAAERAQMPPPLIEYKNPTYTTSVTHQLHCLYMIMHGFNDLVLNHGAFAMDMAGTDDDDGLTREGEDPAEHLSHCFDYLRQAIMCHGDTALEGRQTTFGPYVGGSDGWNARHVCKPWNRIYDWLEDNRIDDREWI